MYVLNYISTNKSAMTIVVEIYFVPFDLELNF
jgi:hypothetical protein